MTTNEELRVLAEQATPGEWVKSKAKWGYDHEYTHTVEAPGEIKVVCGTYAELADDDSRFIAAANPARVLALLDEVDRCDKPSPCDIRHQAPYDFAHCETHDTTFALGEKCKWDGVDSISENLQDEIDEQRGLKVRAEMERDRLFDEVERLRAQVERVREVHRVWTEYEHEDACTDTSDGHREEHHHESADDIGEYYCDQKPLRRLCDACRDDEGFRMEQSCPTIQVLDVT